MWSRSRRMVNIRRGGYKSYIMLRLKVYLVNLLEASNLRYTEFGYKMIPKYFTQIFFFIFRIGVYV